MPIPDPLAAVVSYLLADTEVQVQVGLNVFGAELPPLPDLGFTMPAKCMVVAYAGGTAIGPGARSKVPIGLYRMDVKAYGATPFDASAVYLAAMDRLVRTLERSVERGTTLLHNAVIAGGPIGLRDSDLDWPMVLSTYEIMISEVTVT